MISWIYYPASFLNDGEYEQKFIYKIYSNVEATVEKSKIAPGFLISI